MDSALLSTQSSLPGSPSSVGTRRGKGFVPLTSHGMPKVPKSPGGSIRPHRFSTFGSPRSPVFSSPPMTPMSLKSPMSPPMSAKSFSTFIDSEPSTPAYSPRMGTDWDSSTLMLLSPVSTTPSSTAPSSPPEPAWEMLTPARKRSATSTKPKFGSSLVKDISTGTSLSSHPVKATQEEAQKEDIPPTEDNLDAELKPTEEQTPQAAPLERLATKMKSILRRKPLGDKKGERRIEKKRKHYEGLHYMEDVHWTEM